MKINRQKMLIALAIVLMLQILSTLTVLASAFTANDVSNKNQNAETENDLLMFNESIKHTKKETRKTVSKQAKPKAHWESLGYCRITEYCPQCNDPVGTYQSSSGATLCDGYVACNWLSNGTKIKIDGVEYVVMDTCGTDAIDIFNDTEVCQCARNEYQEVQIWKP